MIGRLRRAGCVAAEEEAAHLIEAAPDVATLERWVERREQGEPLAWITGSVDFCGRRLHVDPGVYVPRAQSEELARRAAAALAPGQWAADLCTGAGAIAAHLMETVPGAVVVGTDLDPVAAGCARRNGVPAVVGNLGDPLRGGVFDVVTAVVPYVPSSEMRFLPADVVIYEPIVALDGGPDGLDVVRAAVAAAARLLRGGGRLFMELGGDQLERLAPTLAEAGFDQVTAWADEDGDQRAFVARWGNGR